MTCKDPLITFLTSQKKNPSVNLLQECPRIQKKTVGISLKPSVVTSDNSKESRPTPTFLPVPPQ